jgi:DNA-binding sugar fermentation-stimulating protein
MDIKKDPQLFRELTEHDFPRTLVPFNECFFFEQIIETEEYDKEPRHDEPQFLLRVMGLSRGQVIRRPSCKWPHVNATVDVFCEETNRVYLAHAPMLACQGLTDVGAEVYISEMESWQKENQPDYVQASEMCIYTSVYHEPEKKNEQIIGVWPPIAQEVVDSALEKNYFSLLKNTTSVRRDMRFTIEGKVDSQFDFTGYCDDGVPFIMQVQNIPFADYEDVSIKERRSMDFRNRAANSKIAIYPDGARRYATITDPELQAIKDLTTIKQESIIRCVLCNVINRDDIDRYNPSRFDSVYRALMRDAVKSGVVLINLIVKWDREGYCYFIRDDVPTVRF